MSKKTEIELAGKKLTVSNREKVLYPEVGFTKGQVIDYYIRIAPVLLPHLKNRPITLKRYPDSVDGFFFYEKQCPAHRPDWVKTTEVPSRREAGKIDYCLMNDLPALIWAANLEKTKPFAHALAGFRAGAYSFRKSYRFLMATPRTGEAIAGWGRSEEPVDANRQPG